jgi:hypothetical protein
MPCRPSHKTAFGLTQPKFVAVHCLVQSRSSLWPVFSPTALFKFQDFSLYFLNEGVLYFISSNYFIDNLYTQIEKLFVVLKYNSN